MNAFPAYADQFALDGNPAVHQPYRNTYDDEYNWSGYASLPSNNRLQAYSTPSHHLSAMQRYLVGPDESPFTANPFHSTLKRLEMGGGLIPHNVVIPDDFQRGGSPADTSSSANSHLTINHSEYASDHLGRNSISSQSAYSPAMSCENYDMSQMQQAHFAPGGGACVSLNIVQPIDPDQSHEDPEECAMVHRSHMENAYDAPYDEYHIKVEQRYDSHQEGEDVEEPQSMTDRESSEVPDADHDEDNSDTEYKPNRRMSSGKRPHRRQSSSSSGSARSQRRNSRSQKGQHSNPTSGRVEKSRGKSGKNAGIRHFPCPLASYGCQSSFSSKNEWKRHVSTQHIKLGYWRCKLCPPADPNNPTYNDFNRKDLFTQHLRRMHANVDVHGRGAGMTSPKKGVALTNAVSEEFVAEQQKHCYRELRQTPPRSSCLFCTRSFSGKDSWHERMDHIGTHFEKDQKTDTAKGSITDIATWRKDQELEDWFLEEGLVEQDDKGRWKLGDGMPLRAEH